PICGSSPPSDLGAFVRLVRIASTPEDSDETATQPRGDVSDPVHGRGPQPAGGAYIDSSRGSATADRPTERRLERSIMKRTLPAIALITGLTLAGCSGGQDGGQDEDGSDSAAEEATQLDEATLKELLESTDAQGQSFTYIDTSEASGSEALKALDNAEFEPSECKDLSMAALGAAEASDSTTVTGVSSDNTLSVGLVSLADEDAAGS